MHAQGAGEGKPRLWQVLGPGLITGAADDDPSGIATYTQAGAQFGFQLGWSLLLSYPLMVVVQGICARIGRTTGKGIAGNLRDHYPRWLLYGIVVVLFAANTLNIGADLGAMGAAMHLLLPWVPSWADVTAFGIACAVAQIVIPYARYVAILKWLTLSLFSYVAALLVVGAPWGQLASGVLLPHFTATRDFWMMLVAILGTTISPYLFFWQASQEVEDTKANPTRVPLKENPSQAPTALARIQLDTAVGMGFSNLVALAILATGAATLHAAGHSEITSAAQAAEALRPIAGTLAFAVFALGIIGTGLLSIPVLAGSAAYAVGEARKFPVGLAKQPAQAKAFYGAIAAATLLGAAANVFGLNPVRALVWSAVLNGIVAVPIMVLLMFISTSKPIMGRFTVSHGRAILGWVATGTMALASLIFCVLSALPLRGALGAARIMGSVSTEAIGWTSTAILLLTLLRQVYTEWKSRSTAGLSRWLFIGQVAASVGFTTYSVLLRNWVFAASNLAILLIAVLGQMLYARNRRLARKKTQ